MSRVDDLIENNYVLARHDGLNKDGPGQLFALVCEVNCHGDTFYLIIGDSVETITDRAEAFEWVDQIEKWNEGAE